jgi:hypothetical protein
MADSTCFWFNQGKCALSHFPADLVLSILASNPTARRDLLKCDVSCTDVSLDYIAYAEQDGTLRRDEITLTDEHHLGTRQYRDNTRQIHQAPRLPDVLPDSEEDP